LAIVADSVVVERSFRQKSVANGFVKALEFKHRLRVCNAYPYSSALDIYLTKDKLTDSPMGYKSCKDFTHPLKSGDKLDFRVGDASAGTFAVSDLPNNDAILLLVIHRHDALSTAVSFESHVFANLVNAQVAVIDTYKGKAVSTPKIKDVPSKDDKKAVSQSRLEELRYNSVVAINPGRYMVELDDSAGKMAAQSELVALNRESYVVIRAGVEATQGPAYPQELIIYPNSDASLLQSGAYSVSLSAAAAMATLAAMISW
jgi:hypothetical protein